MIEKFLNIMRVQSQYSQNAIAQTVLGQITNYDPTQFAAIVELYAADPSDATSQPLTTGWLPICVPAIGWYPAPSIGDLCVVHFQEANQQQGFINLVSYTGTPTQQVPSGEWWFFRPDGSYLKFTNDGKLQLSGNVEIDITAPVVNISGAVNLGDLMIAVTPLMTGIAQSVYNSHTHNVSGSVTLAPNQQMDSTTLTSNIKGN